MLDEVEMMECLCKIDTTSAYELVGEIHNRMHASNRFLASQSIPTWNRIVAWLKEMNSLCQHLHD